MQVNFLYRSQRKTIFHIFSQCLIFLPKNMLSSVVFRAREALIERGCCMNVFFDERIKVMSVDDPKIIELSRSIKSWAQVLRTAMRLGDVTDNSMQIQLGIDKGNFSRILSGQANFPVDKLVLFCEIVGNDLPIHWIAYQRGYELRVIPKLLEQQIEQKNKAIKEREERIAYLEGQMELLKEVISSIGSNLKNN